MTAAGRTPSGGKHTPPTAANVAGARVPRPPDQQHTSTQAHKAAPASPHSSCPSAHTAQDAREGKPSASWRLKLAHTGTGTEWALGPGARDGVGYQNAPSGPRAMARRPGPRCAAFCCRQLLLLLPSYLSYKSRVPTFLSQDLSQEIIAYIDCRRPPRRSPPNPYPHHSPPLTTTSSSHPSPGPCTSISASNRKRRASHSRKASGQVATPDTRSRLILFLFIHTPTPPTFHCHCHCHTRRSHLHCLPSLTIPHPHRPVLHPLQRLPRS